MPDLNLLLGEIFNVIGLAATWIGGLFIFVLVVGIIADYIEKKKPFP